MLASGDVFVTDPEVRSGSRRTRTWSTWRATPSPTPPADLGVPVTLVKHVSDNADESALDWASVVSVSARALGEWLTCPPLVTPTRVIARSVEISGRNDPAGNNGVRRRCAR